MILLKNLTKKFADRSILKEVSYHFPKGERIALVGHNGAGKTTFLNILCGLDEADEGEIIQPRDYAVSYLPQSPNADPKPTILEECMAGAVQLCDLQQKLDKALKDMGENYSDELYEVYEQLEAKFSQQGGYELEANAKGILVGLGFKNDHFSQAPQILSGGWRMRLELAKILVNEPDFLVLDEPTNHLDLPSLVWLENYLQEYSGTLLFVSHDQDLLNRLATYTLHLNSGILSAYKGNFDAFMEQYALSQEQTQQQLKNIQKQYDHMEKFVERFGSKASKATQAQSRVKMLAKLSEKQNQIAENAHQKIEEISLPMRLNRNSGVKILNLEKCVIGYEKPLAKNLNIALRRGQRVAIIGSNGIGKSTFLKSIVGNVPWLQGESLWGHGVEWGYYAQDTLEQLDPEKTALENVLAENPQGTEFHARQLLGCFLIRGQDVFKPLKVLSGGESSRVGLSCLLAKGSNFLILDEPTNHLDMASTDNLAEAFSQFPGTILFISHNRRFINTVATHIFAMTEDGRGQLFEGQLDDYERLAEKQGFPNIFSRG